MPDIAMPSAAASPSAAGIGISPIVPWPIAPWSITVSLVGPWFILLRSTSGAAGRAAGTGGFWAGAGVARFGFAGDALAFFGAAFFGAGISMPGMLCIEWSCPHAGTDRPKVAAVINAVRSVLMPRLPWDGH